MVLTSVGIVLKKREKGTRLPTQQNGGGSTAQPAVEEDDNDLYSTEKKPNLSNLPAKSTSKRIVIDA